MKFVHLFVCALSNRGSGAPIHVSRKGVGSTLRLPLMELFSIGKVIIFPIYVINVVM